MRFKASKIAMVLSIALFASAVGSRYWNAKLASQRPTPQRNIRVDLGTLVEGRSYDHMFKVWNRRGKPLRILDVRCGCYCTRILSVSGSSIAPGSFVQIEARFTPEGRPGVKQQAIVVVTDDPSEPMILLHFFGTLTTSGMGNGGR